MGIQCQWQASKFSYYNVSCARGLKIGQRKIVKAKVVEYCLQNTATIENEHVAIRLKYCLSYNINVLKRNVHENSQMIKFKQSFWNKFVSCRHFEI